MNMSNPKDSERPPPEGPEPLMQGCNGLVDGLETSFQGCNGLVDGPEPSFQGCNGLVDGPEPRFRGATRKNNSINLKKRIFLWQISFN